MQLFRHGNRQKSEASKRLYARFEMIHTFVDFTAAICFLVGSVCFFFDDPLRLAGVWLFVIGSICFAAKPTIRLTREIKLYRMGRIETLAERDQV